MLTLIEKDSVALGLLDKYYSYLSTTGYVKKSTNKRYLVYLFLLDFLNIMCAFFTEEDYEKLNRLLVALFSNGDCLLPYHVFEKCRTIIGYPYYMGNAMPRITEVNRIIRNSEELDVRFKA